MTIIGLTGKAGCGKTTASDVLVNKGFQRLSYAKPLKEIAKSLGWDGEKDERGRMGLQLLGTDVARLFDPQIWVKKMAQKILDIEETNKYYQDQTMIVIDDVRFDNEAQLIKDLDGFIVQITGREMYSDGQLNNHQSEAGVSKELIDYVWDFPNFEDPKRFAEEFNKKITWLIG